MANTSSVPRAFVAIVFLASFSLSSVFAQHNSDIHELSLLREKRQKEAEVFYLKNNSPLKLEEELSEPKVVYERAVYAEEAKEVGQDDERKKQEEQKKLSVESEMSNTTEEEEQNVQVIIKICHLFIVANGKRKINSNESKSKTFFRFQDDVFSYRTMHDLIDAFILADEMDVVQRLQQLQEVRLINY